MSSPVLLVTRNGAITRLAMNRPSSKNSLDPELIDALGAALEAAAEDGGVRVIVLEGVGGAFCSGVDLRSAAADIQAPERLRTRLDGFHRLIRAIASAEKPVIAAVDGPAVGFGADLAFACDLRVVSQRGYFQEKFVGIGLMPDGGGTFHLPRLIGLGRAMEHLMLGTRIDAEAALALGIANRVVAPDALDAETSKLAEELAAGPPLALRAIKRAVRENLTATLDQALGRELEGQLRLLRSADVVEGVGAFLQRRPPVFKGE